MVFQVTMSEQEASEFLQYREHKKKYTMERDRIGELAQTVLRAIESDPEKGGKVIIADQDYAEELLEMAAMYAR